MINISVIGACGKMGRLICSNIIAANDLSLSGAIDIDGHPNQNHDIGLLISGKDIGTKVSSSVDELLDKTDIFIDFSTGNVIKNTELIIRKGKGIVIGTTGLNDAQKTKLLSLSKQYSGKIVFAPNMSIGVNLLFHISKLVAEKLNDSYEIEIVEMHHNLKKDAPSGTAEKLAEIVAEARGLNINKEAKYGRHGIVGPREKNEIGIHVLRGGDVVGDHTVIFAAEGERLELTHKATSKQVFAKGAVEAARFLYSAEPGIYNMQDVLDIK